MFRTFATTLTRRTTTTSISGYRNSSISRANMADLKTKWTAPAVRKQFLDFFKEKEHTIGTWRGSSICPIAQNLPGDFTY